MSQQFKKWLKILLIFYIAFFAFDFLADITGHNIDDWNVWFALVLGVFISSKIIRMLTGIVKSFLKLNMVIYFKSS